MVEVGCVCRASNLEEGGVEGPVAWIAQSEYIVISLLQIMHSKHCISGRLLRVGLKCAV